MLSVLLAIAAGTAAAQPYRALPQSDLPRLSFSYSAAMDTIRVETDADTSVVPVKSSMKAMLLSAVLPGAGQFYTERYWKIPIIWGFGIWLSLRWADANRLYLDYRTLHAEAVKTSNGYEATYKNARDWYHDERDKAIFYLAVTYLLNILDAYVGAQLFSFEVNDDLGKSQSIRLTIPLR